MRAPRKGFCSFLCSILHFFALLVLIESLYYGKARLCEHLSVNRIFLSLFLLLLLLLLLSILSFFTHSAFLHFYLAPCRRA